MTTPIKPIRLTIGNLKEIVGENQQLVRASDDDSENVLTDAEVKAIEVKAKKDYDCLCKVLGLSQIPLDVYRPSEKSEVTTELGTPIKNFTPGYNSRNVILPIIPGVATSGESDLPFPPSTWAIMSPEWPRWRLDLWHEILHQVEHDIYGTWDGSDEKHGASYLRAIEYAVSKIKVVKKVSFQELRVLALGC